MNIVSITPLLKEASFFNVAAWHKRGSENIILVGRELSQKGSRGEPDVGKIVLYEINPKDEILHKRVVWEPKYESFYLEDPRAFVYNDGRIVIGLTVVLRAKRGIQTFPGLATVTGDWNSYFPPVTLIQTFGPGKNITPIIEDYFLFRPDSEQYTHKLLVFYYKDSLPKKVGDLSFPKNLAWASWKIGAGCPPIWINEKRGIFIIHGISVKNSKYCYSIGISLIRKEGGRFFVDIYKEPILDGEMLRRSVKVKQLRPKVRNVVYVCGGLFKPKNNLLHLYVNVGDSSTFDIAFRLDDIKKALKL